MSSENCPELLMQRVASFLQSLTASKPTIHGVAESDSEAEPTEFSDAYNAFEPRLDESGLRGEADQTSEEAAEGLSERLNSSRDTETHSERRELISEVKENQLSSYEEVIIPDVFKFSASEKRVDNAQLYSGHTIKHATKITPSQSQDADFLLNAIIDNEKQGKLNIFEDRIATGDLSLENISVNFLAKRNPTSLNTGRINSIEDRMINEDLDKNDIHESSHEQDLILNKGFDTYGANVEEKTVLNLDIDIKNGHKGAYFWQEQGAHPLRAQSKFNEIYGTRINSYSKLNTSNRESVSLNQYMHEETLLKSEDGSIKYQKNSFSRFEIDANTVQKRPLGPDVLDSPWSLNSYISDSKNDNFKVKQNKLHTTLLAEKPSSLELGLPDLDGRQGIDRKALDLLVLSNGRSSNSSPLPEMRRIAKIATENRSLTDEGHISVLPNGDFARSLTSEAPQVAGSQGTFETPDVKIENESTILKSSSFKFPNIEANEAELTVLEKYHLVKEEISARPSAVEMQRQGAVTQVRSGGGSSFDQEPWRPIEIDAAFAKQRLPAMDGAQPATKEVMPQSVANPETQTRVNTLSSTYTSEKVSNLEAETKERNGYQEILSASTGQIEGVSRAQNSAPSTLASAQAPPILRQIAEQLRIDASGVIDLRLEPEELGRLRITISAGEAGFHVQIIGDRLETIDLLRRHAAALERVFSDAGLDLASFGFGSRLKDNDQAHGTIDGDTMNETTALPAQSTKTVPGAGTGHDCLDLRL